jgi:hypothetical protein
MLYNHVKIFKISKTKSVIPKKNKRNGIFDLEVESPPGYQYICIKILHPIFWISS